MTNAADILKRLQAKKATNINNILTTTNHTNDTNDKTTTIIVKDNQVDDQSLRSSLGRASPSASQESKELQFDSGIELPPNWLNFKWDLFKNPSAKSRDQLRLNLNIVRKDGTQAKLTASLNSPHDRVWRKVTDEERADPHWSLVEEEYRTWRRTYGPNLEDWRASKFYQPGKKDSTRLVIFLREQHDLYQLRLFYRAAMWDYSLLKTSREQLTIKQIQGNQIATLFVGAKARKILTEDDLGI
jgi:hypothetical protein